MKTPNFIKNAVRTKVAKEQMRAGTQFLNGAIDAKLTAKDLLACLAIAIDEGWSLWSIARLHGTYNRRRLLEERAQLSLL